MYSMLTNCKYILFTMSAVPYQILVDIMAGTQPLNFDEFKEKLLEYYQANLTTRDYSGWIEQIMKEDKIVENCAAVTAIVLNNMELWKEIDCIVMAKYTRLIVKLNRLDMFDLLIKYVDARNTQNSSKIMSMIFNRIMNYINEYNNSDFGTHVFLNYVDNDKFTLKYPDVECIYMETPLWRCDVPVLTPIQI